MKNLFTYLKALWGAWGNLQSSEVGFDYRLTVGSPSGFGRKSLLKLVSVLVIVFTLGVGNAWGDSYTITFSGTNSESTGISTSTTAASITGSSSYVTGNVAAATKAYGATSSGIKLGTSSAAGSIKINLSASGQVTPTSIVVNAKRYNSGTAATLKVNGSATQSLTSSYADYTFDITSAITYIQLDVSKYSWVKSITVNYTPGGGGGGSCNAIDVTGGSAVILPAGKESYTGGEWEDAGAPTAYPGSTTEYTIGAGSYCVTLTKVADYSKNSNGIQFQASNGVLSIAGITSTSGVDVEVWIGSGSGFSIALTGATTLTGQSSGKKTISTTSTTATLTISKTSSGAGYVKYIKVSPKAASCDASPSVGNAANNGALVYSTTPMTVPITCPSIGAGDGCEINDYGFVWRSGGNPTIANNKTQIGTDNHSTAFNGNISGTFAAGTTYYVKAYAINTGDNTTLSSGTYSFTPRSITMNSNGGSAVATILVISGTAATQPVAPTKEGYTFGGWYTDNGTFASAVDWSSNITSNQTYYAKWTAKTTTISFNQTSGTGGQTGTLTATYDAAMPSAPVTCPTREGYDFGGYYDGSGGTGTQYYTSTGASARNWDKEDATYTLHAKWTVKTTTVSFNQNGGDGGQTSSLTATYGSAMPTPITKPTKDGYIFDGYYESSGGTGTKYYNANGTSATTWDKEDATWTLYAKWVDKGCTTHAGTNVTSGTTPSNQLGPVDLYYKYCTRQILYTKTDLNLGATKKGTIKSIYFDYATAVTKKGSVKIYMANTSLTALSTSNYVPFESFTEVYDGSFNSASTGYQEIELTTSFEYNGLGNLVVLIDDNSGQYELSTNFNTHTATTTTGAQIYKQNDSSNEDPSTTNWSTYTASNSRPNTKFCIQEADMVKATVTLMDNGATITEASAGAGVTLPSRAGCTGYTFAGWTKTWVASQSSWTTTAPTIIPAGSYTPSANENLYPVYTKTEGGGMVFDEYEKCTTAPDDWTAYKYIYATADDGYALAGKASGGNYGDYASFSTTTEMADYELTLEEGSTGNYKVKQGGKYISCSSFGNLYWVDTYTAKTSSVNNGDWQLYKPTGTAYRIESPVQNSNNKWIYIDYNSSSPRFNSYVSGGQTAAYLYKRKEKSGSTTYYISVPNCCTPLGTINGSNLSTSSTGTSVSVSVLTEGVNAYGDANNVSGYDFNLYTASAGGDAAASYSTNSKAGTSHEFTGLTPLTQYWVTVRPIGSGSYCNTTAESSRVQIATTCVAPNHVDISGRWDRFGGETISLTATAYSSAGTSSPIDAEDITGYQWQKLISSTWTDVSDGTTDGVTTSGATTNNLQISNCKLNNSGKYRCIISTGAGCTTASAAATDGTEGFDVKVYVLECYTGGTTVYNFTRVGDTQAGTAQITLTAGNKEFKVHADNYYYGKNVTINEDENNVVLCNSGDAVCSANLTIAAGLGGTFTFTMDYSTSGSSSVEGEPEISVTYPRKTIYLTPGVWNSGEAKFAFYYFRKVGETIYGEGFTDFITADDCGSSADIPQWNGVKINAVRLNSNTTASDLTNSANHYKAAWDKKWNQTSDITITSNNSISITGWGPDNGDSPYDYGTYAVPTYTISYATGSVPTGGGSISGSKANETKTCGVDFDLPAAQFTTTGYVQTGWAKTDGGAQYAAVSGSYTDNSAQTFYPVWTANTHTLTWDKNGGDALTGDYTSGTVAYATAITAPNTPTRTGYSFDGWHNGSSIVTPATTMPDNDLSYTAQWSLASYTVTLNTNGGTIKAGNVTSYTYGTGATLPTNVTRDGYRFDGWFSDDGVWSDQVTAISTTATGDKTYYAKWTQVYTVTWSVNGETWSSGVVDGNTYVVDGQRVSALPTAPTTSDCDDSKVFVGWRATAIDGTSTSDPGGIFTTQAGSPTIDADKTFYAVFADASPRQVISLTFPDDNSDNNGLTSNQYTSEWTAKAGTFSFTVNNFNNNNWGGSWEWIKCGRKSNASVAKITTDTDVDFRVDSVYITIGSIADSYVNSAKLQISSSSDFGTKTEMDIPQSTGTQKLKIASPATDKYYRIVYDCASHTSSNGFVQINSLEFIQKSETSNYVTTCSSCDADATFTNTTPAVSDIDCTSATLTATGGLATVGADGCHVSDYGFVIGKSDNPVIGGSGVTKLQVGTSDPTIGEDFSYDATGLTKGTHYYIRAYAINRHGTAYSSSTNFWTNNVSSIAITTAPTKTNYIVGETFDATGMVVTATMADSNTEDVTSDVTYSSSALTAGTSQNFAINYTLCETEKSVNQVINVYTLTVTEGTNPSYGTATNSSANIVSITGLGDHKTYTVTVTSSNATAVDNGDNTWSIINPTGNVTVRVDYADAVQVKVSYKVDGVTVTGLTQDVYQSETTTLPSASDLATAMTAQGMEIPDGSYPNFVGWSETEFGAQTSEPTLVTGTPTINAEKTYYAVYTNLNKITIIPSDFSTSYPSSGSADGTKTFGGKRFGWNYLLNGNVSKTNLPLQFKKNSTEYGRLYNTDPLNYILRVEIGYYDATSNVPVYVASSAGTISGGALTPASRESTDPYVYTMPASTSYFYIKGDNSTVYKIRSVDIYYSSATVYYMTQFCTNRVTLTQNSPEHGTVEFGRSSLVTCGSDKNVSLTIIPDVGYQLTGWTVNTSSGYADAKTTSPAVVTNNNNSAAQNITLTFAEDANKDYDVTATFGLMTVTSWAWTVNSAAIPDPLNLYVGQRTRMDVAYTPAGVDASKKTYTREKNNTYINWVGDKQAAYSTIEGRASTGENTTPVTFTHGDGPTTTVNVKVLPLPLVHFGDIVHNVSFDDVVATLSDNTLSPTKTTPTHADFDGSTANTCEEQHLHLVGWIREDWPALVTYLNGGAQPSTDDITGAGNDGSGNAYFFAPGASINTQTFNGVTFYAVWAKVE